MAVRRKSKQAAVDQCLSESVSLSRKALSNLVHFGMKQFEFKMISDISNLLVQMSSR